MKTNFKAGQLVFENTFHGIELSKLEGQTNGPENYPLETETDTYTEDGKMFDTHALPRLFHATPANRAALVTLYGEDKVPQLPISGSVLTATLLESQKFVLAWVDDASEEQAREDAHLKRICGRNRHGFEDIESIPWAYAVPVDPITGEEITGLPANKVEPKLIGSHLARELLLIHGSIDCWIDDMSDDYARQDGDVKRVTHWDGSHFITESGTTWRFTVPVDIEKCKEITELPTVVVKNNPTVKVGDKLVCTESASNSIIRAGDTFTVTALTDDGDDGDDDDAMIIFSAVSNAPEGSYTFCISEGEIQCRFFGHTPAVFKKL